MPLPGKLCIGILEEDNPIKSYFRFKPLLVEEAGLYVPFNEPDAYPDDGCIRIVPDKNESSHFKARMRRIGLFAVVDLSDHPNENDKIRANKNYRGDDTERNSHIIYSDIVHEPAANMIFSLLSMTDEEAASVVLTEAPGASSVLLCADDGIQAKIWKTVSVEEQENARRLTCTGQCAAVSDLQVFDLPGFDGKSLSFAILPPTKVESVIEPIPPRQPKTVQSAPVEAHHEPEPAPAPTEPAEPAPVKEKPRVNPAPAPVEPVRTNLQQVLAAQCGLNPRRGRSLQEIIDDKWRHSRIDQLGHPVPGTSNATPLQSPAENALSALRSAWDHPEQRDALLQALATVDGLEDAIDIRRAAVRQSAVNAQLNDLEAQRLSILADLDALKQRRIELRETFKQEIRQDEAAAFADAVRKTEQAQAECARHQEAAAKARTAAACAEDALNALADGRFEKRLEEFAINSRAADLLRKLDQPVSKPEVQTCSADAEQLIARVLGCFADAGAPIDRMQAVNLLICAAQSPVLLVSGPAGSGKTTTIRLLARAMGVEKSGFATFAPGKDSLEKDDAVAALKNSTAPAVVLLDDANLCPNADLTRGIAPDLSGPLLCATLQDDGAPVPAYLLGRAFLIRLNDEAAAPWQPAPRSVPKDCEPVSREALASAFAPQADAVPQTVLERMEKLRADLALLDVRLSRKTLDALWNYCAAAIPAMSAAPIDVFDLAFAQRALPAILAGAPLKSLVALPNLLKDLPQCQKLLKQSLPIQL